MLFSVVRSNVAFFVVWGPEWRYKFVKPFVIFL